jgi:hypothetical protein
MFYVVGAAVVLFSYATYVTYNSYSSISNPLFVMLSGRAVESLSRPQALPPPCLKSKADAKDRASYVLQYILQAFVILIVMVAVSPHG